jgi:hypothetical protein
MAPSLLSSPLLPRASATAVGFNSVVQKTPCWCCLCHQLANPSWLATTLPTIPSSTHAYLPLAQALHLPRQDHCTAATVDFKLWMTQAATSSITPAAQQCQARSLPIEQHIQATQWHLKVAALKETLGPWHDPRVLIMQH